MSRLEKDRKTAQGRRIRAIAARPAGNKKQAPFSHPNFYVPWALASARNCITDSAVSPPPPPSAVRPNADTIALSTPRRPRICGESQGELFQAPAKLVCVCVRVCECVGVCVCVSKEVVGRWEEGKMGRMCQWLGNADVRIIVLFALSPHPLSARPVDPYRSPPV